MNNGDNYKKRNQREGDMEIIPVSSGSGFAVSSLGHIVTNGHVIADCAKILVHKDGELHNAKIVSSDKINDLAVVKIDLKFKHIFKLSLKVMLN